MRTHQGGWPSAQLGVTDGPNGSPLNRGPAPNTRPADGPRLVPSLASRGSTALVAVIGPPGAGKSTIVAALAGVGGVPVFRLREAIRARPTLLAGLAPTTDPLGWVSLEAVRRVVHTVFIEDRFGLGASTVLLDNFPGTAAQLDLLAEFTARTGARLALLELEAQARTVVARVADRRVCPSCGPDPHAPAIPAADDPERCGSCTGRLARRETDPPRLHGLRLARYTANRPEIAECAAALGIVNLTVNADASTPEVRRMARHALDTVTDPARYQGSRS